MNTARAAQRSARADRVASVSATRPAPAPTFPGAGSGMNSPTAVHLDQDALVAQQSGANSPESPNTPGSPSAAGFGEDGEVPAPSPAVTGAGTELDG